MLFVVFGLFGDTRSSNGGVETVVVSPATFSTACPRADKQWHIPTNLLWVVVSCSSTDAGWRAGIFVGRLRSLAVWLIGPVLRKW